MYQNMVKRSYGSLCMIGSQQFIWHLKVLYLCVKRTINLLYFYKLNMHYMYILIFLCVLVVFILFPNDILFYIVYHSDSIKNKNEFYVIFLLYYISYSILILNFDFIYFKILSLYLICINIKIII